MKPIEGLFGAGILGVVVLLLGPGRARTGPPERQEDEAKRVAAHLEMFDDLDYDVFSNQKWQEFHRSHSKDVTVHWPDGHVTKGIEKHIEDLKAMFVWAPDTRIKEHPVKVG
ncbi:MAG: hypothetical protein L0323_22115 [Planctomycetes bacterium]|nr:hypothetical protein [Planctomycetota bacterium]